MKMKKTITLLSLLILLLFSCREKYFVSSLDYCDYGWDYFSRGSLNQALNHFLTAIETDSSHVDGYNGAGWSSALLNRPDSAHTFFNEGLSIYSQASDSNYFYVYQPAYFDMLAGRCLVANVQGDWQRSASDGAHLLTENNRWQLSLSDDESLSDYEDIYATTSASYFALGKFDSAYFFIGQLHQIIHDQPIESIDLDSPGGISKLAIWIEALRP
jgi:tetratricopeptide (TPR) repeat protein